MEWDINRKMEKREGMGKDWEKGRKGRKKEEKEWSM